MKVDERFGDTQRGLLMELGSMLIVTLFVISYSLCVVMGIGRNLAMGRVDVGKWEMDKGFDNVHCARPICVPAQLKAPFTRAKGIASQLTIRGKEWSTRT